MWEDDEFDLDLVTHQNTVAKETKMFGPLLRLYLFFLFMFQTLFRLSDNAMDTLLRFFAMFFKSLSQKITLPSSFVEALPTSLHKACVVGGYSRDDFDRYVCCPNCHTLYPLSDCLSNGEEPKRCSFVVFPNHPQASRRRPCNTPLMKKIKTTRKGSSLYPRLVYCYKSVIDSLQDMLKRPGFFDSCDCWRDRNEKEGVYTDVYDGKLWKEFLNPEGVPFLSLANNYAFQLNVDWFNPYTHTQHSEGAIYLTILNLPREKRFLQENVILAGVIPGPKEPSLNINSFLKPLVIELQNLWQGVVLKNDNDQPVIVRAALLCCTCDIPAGRKTCGFVGHGAIKGCSKCLLSFPTYVFGEKPDYSNFNRSEWEPRTSEHHRVIAKKHSLCETQVAKKSLEREFGVRYSVLLELPYFDPVRMCVIDPMHNLLLGTAKHITEVWKNRSILSCKNFESIQEKVNTFTSPGDIGRIPYKISSGFSGFTADQWKNWVIFYSLYALKDILPWQHYNCWHLFVKICFLLCRRRITVEQIQKADSFIIQFCEMYKHLYGSDSCNINIHLHGHIVECVYDFGPVYSFWCFAYERMNGVLGSYHTNNHNISVQYMHRFLDSKSYAAFNWPKEFSDEYLTLLQKFSYNKGSLQQTTLETQLSQMRFTPLPPVLETALTPTEKQVLQPMFKDKCQGQSFKILTLCMQTKALLVGDFVLGAKKSRHSQASLVLAEHSEDRLELAEIQYFARGVAILDQNPTTSVEVWFAFVHWFEEHPCKVWYGHPVQVWTTVTCTNSFIPVSSIQSRVVFVKCTRDFGSALCNDTVYVVVPLMSH